jgi:hypothetical protein
VVPALLQPARTSASKASAVRNRVSFLPVITYSLSLVLFAFFITGTHTLVSVSSG